MGEKELFIELSFKINRPWKYSSEEVNRQYITEMERDGSGIIHIHRMTEFQDREIVLKPKSNRNFGFPLIPAKREAILEIVVSPRIKLTEFSFPPGLGGIELHKVREQYKILA